MSPTADIRVILLVPSDAHRAALLAGGPCRSRPPIATGPGWRGYTDGYDEKGWTAGDDVGSPKATRALVLAWDGALVPEGRDRAISVLRDHDSTFGDLDVLWILHALPGPIAGERVERAWILAGFGDGGELQAAVWFARPGEECDLEVPGLEVDGDGPIDRMLALARCCAARGLGSVTIVTGPS